MSREYSTLSTKRQIISRLPCSCFFVTVLFKLAIQPLRDGTDLRENVQTALGNFRVMYYVIYVIWFPVEKAKKTFWFTKLLSFFKTCSTLCVFRVSQMEISCEYFVATDITVTKIFEKNVVLKENLFLSVIHNEYLNVQLIWLM